MNDDSHAELQDRLNGAMMKIKRLNAVIQERDVTITEVTRMSELLCRTLEALIAASDVLIERMGAAQVAVTELTASMALNNPQSLRDMQGILKKVHDLLKT